MTFSFLYCQDGVQLSSQSELCVEEREKSIIRSFCCPSVGSCCRREGQCCQPVDHSCAGLSALSRLAAIASVFGPRLAQIPAFYQIPQPNHVVSSAFSPTAPSPTGELPSRRSENSIEHFSIFCSIGGKGDLYSPWSPGIMVNKCRQPASETSRVCNPHVPE